MYPESVEKVSLDIYECFEEDLVKIISRKDAKWCKEISLEVIRKFMLPKFLNGDELLLTEEEVPKLYGKCMADLTLASLKERGLVDMMEDENGKEMIFLTKDGREQAERMFNKEV
jgi:hypothetical protein